VFEAKEAQSAAGYEDPTVLLDDYFNLLRRPGWSYAALWQQD